MAVETRQVARLIKRNKNNKIRKVITIYRNDLGWVKTRTDQGKDEWIDDIETLNSKIDRWLLQGYVFDGTYEIPTEITNKNTTPNDDNFNLKNLY